MIELGSKVKDLITGFTGIAVARDEWLYGCVRIGIKSQDLKDGKPIDIEWVDEPQVVVIQNVVLQPTKLTKHEGPRIATGGPREDPPSR
jgi:hypothetical protein